MISPIPTIQVPVNMFLTLLRNYVEQPQEYVDRRIYLDALQLEKRAYRKYLAHKKELKENEK